MKGGSDTFIDIIQQATDDGSGSGDLGFGTRMGVVSFSSSAVVDAPLTASVSQLKGAVDALNAGGTTRGTPLLWPPSCWRRGPIR